MNVAKFGVSGRWVAQRECALVDRSVQHHKSDVIFERSRIVLVMDDHLPSLSQLGGAAGLSTPHFKGQKGAKSTCEKRVFFTRFFKDFSHFFILENI